MSESGTVECPLDPEAVTPDAVLKEELVYLRERANDELWALCLSGGGIRSATFSLGVLQGLAAKGVLGRFHYLSTVSGGGYIGSWLSSWIARSNLQTVLQELAGEAAPRSAEPVQVARLRAYSNYLSPVWGLSTDFFSLISTFLRNLLLNWMVLLPLLAAGVLLPALYVGMFGRLDGLQLPLIVVASFAVLWGIAYSVADATDDAIDEDRIALAVTGRDDNQRVSFEKKETPDRFAIHCFLPIFLAAILLSWAGYRNPAVQDAWPFHLFLLAGAVAHAIGCLAGLVLRTIQGRTRTRHDGKVRDAIFVLASGSAGGALLFALSELSVRVDQRTYATCAAPALLFCYWFATTAYVAMARRHSTEMNREWFARSGAWWLRAALGWVVGFGLVLYGPELFRLLPGMDQVRSTSLVAGGGLLGLITGLIGYWSHGGTQLKERAETFAGAVGVRLLDLAAVAFIVLLIIGMSWVTSRGVERLHDAVFSHTSSTTTDAPNRDKAKKKEGTPGAQDAVAAARGTEAAARAAEAAARATQAAAQAVQAIAATPQQAPQPSAAGTAALVANAETARIAAASAHASASALPQAASSDKAASPKVHEPPRLAAALSLFAALAALGGLTSLAIGANTFSLHSMYGNRLVRAYLGATHLNRKPHWFTGFDPRDNLYMTQLKQNRAESPAGDRAAGTQSGHGDDRAGSPKLLHIINVALNLVKPSATRLDMQQRKAASFTVSALHAGSKQLGYVRSDAYSGARGITMGRAMTISGAAASPNMGYHSAVPVAFVMTLFNARLGWWLPNPDCRHRGVWRRSEPRLNLQPLLTEALARTTDESAYVYLSDGGHFENLGLYEMVKRRCRRIVVVDATCDWKFEFKDLEDAVRKIRVDLGISIVFSAGLPTPERVRRTHRHYAMGVICYAAVDGEQAPDGRICYIKPVLSGDEDLDVTRYAAQHSGKASSFPHQSTGDQFFNESQFESYRMLGRHSVEHGFRRRGEWPDEVPHCEIAGDLETKSASSPAQRAAAATGGAGLASGAGNALSSMSQGALIASAITVGGVLGVSGTVALQDDTLKIEPGAVIALDEQDRKLLRSLSVEGGLALNEEDRKLLRALSIKGGLALDEKDRELLRALSERGIPLSGDLGKLDASVRAVADALVKLTVIVDDLKRVPTGDEGSAKLESAVAALSLQVRNLATAVVNWKPPSSGGTDRIEVYSRDKTAGAGPVDLGDLHKALVAIQDALRVQSAGSQDSRNAARMLEDIIVELQRLRAAVAQTVPNRNVRGVVEGGAR